MNKTLVATGETGCTFGNRTVSLSGIALEYCAPFSAAGLTNLDGLCVTVIKNATNLSVYGNATYHSSGSISLGTSVKDIGTITIGDSVTVLGTAVTATDIGGVLTTDARLSDARAPTAHDHASNKLTQANTHESADTDTAASSIHHTIGSGANQAAAGNHSHTDFTAISARLFGAFL